MTKYKNAWVLGRDQVLKQDMHFLIVKCKHMPGKNHPIHNHILNEIEFMVSGTCTHIINGNKYECREGSIYLLSQLDVHQYTHIDEPVEMYSLCFSDDMIPAEVMDGFKVNESPYYALLTSDLYNIMLSKFRQIENENKNNMFCKKILIKNLISEIVIEIIRHSNPTSHSSLSSNHKTRAALSYIRDNFKEDITLESTALILDITPQYLSRIFKENMDITFHDYLRGLRLDYALRLLNTTNQSITDICFECGFNAPAHFSKIFKERFGISPLQVRKQNSHNSLK